MMLECARELGLGPAIRSMLDAHLAAPLIREAIRGAVSAAAVTGRLPAGYFATGGRLYQWHGDMMFDVDWLVDV